MADFETVLRRMVESRKKMIQENKDHIDDVFAMYPSNATAQIQGSAWFVDRIKTIEVGSRSLKHN